jgi:hypothetical protein
MSQFGRPASDISVGFWLPVPSSPSSLWDKLDEISPNDSDYADLFYNFELNDFEVKFSSVVDPISSSGHILRIRSQDANAVSLSVWLYQGATLIAGLFSTTGQSIWGTDAFTLSGAQADSITNYADLRARVEGGDLSNTAAADVSWIEFEVPDVAVPLVLGKPRARLAPTQRMG